MTNLKQTLASSNARSAPAAIALRWTANRPERVMGVLIAIAALSLVDLYCTLNQMLHVGMFEGNILVRTVLAATGSPLAVVALKLVSLTIAIVLLHRTRSNAKSEAGAWVALGILVVLTVQWIRYLSFMAGMDAATIAEFRNCANWVALG